MNLLTFATDHLESATPLDIQVAPAAITATFPDPEVGDDDYRWTAKLPRFMLSMSLDAESGHRIGNADLMLVTDGRRVLDHVVPGVDQTLTDLIDRVADFYIERYAIQRGTDSAHVAAVQHGVEQALTAQRAEGGQVTVPLSVFSAPVDIEGGRFVAQPVGGGLIEQGCACGEDHSAPERTEQSVDVAADSTSVGRDTGGVDKHTGWATAGHESTPRYGCG